MKIDRKTKPELISKDIDGTRPELAQPYLDLTDAADPRLVATSGHALIALKVEAQEGDTSGPVYLDALVAARKAGNKYDAAELKCAPGALTALNGASFSRPALTGPFPNWRQVLPSAADHENERSVTFDAKLLVAVVAGCGGVGPVTLRFTDDPERFSAPITVEVHGHEARGAIALIMRFGKP